MMMMMMMVRMKITTQIYFISDVFGSVPIVVALTFLYHRNEQPRRRPEK